MTKLKPLMGDISIMNESQLRENAKVLRAALQDLARQDVLGADGQRTVHLDQTSVGRLSRMDAIQQQAMARATAARRSAEETRIRAALARIDDGEFGYCSGCGEEIAPRPARPEPGRGAVSDLCKGIKLGWQCVGLWGDFRLESRHEQIYRLRAEPGVSASARSSGLDPGG